MVQIPARERALRLTPFAIGDGVLAREAAVTADSLECVAMKSLKGTYPGREQSAITFQYDADSRISGGGSSF
jgi:hypothetical protein